MAYSTLGLVMHQDLVYYESPPGLQLLHCMRFDQDIMVSPPASHPPPHVFPSPRLPAPFRPRAPQTPATPQPASASREMACAWMACIAREPGPRKLIRRGVGARQGGESSLADAFHAAEILRERDPKAFATLSRVCPLSHSRRPPAPMRHQSYRFPPSDGTRVALASARRVDTCLPWSRTSRMHQRADGLALRMRLLTPQGPEGGGDGGFSRHGAMPGGFSRPGWINGWRQASHSTGRWVAAVF